MRELLSESQPLNMEVTGEETMAILQSSELTQSAPSFHVQGGWKTDHRVKGQGKACKNKGINKLGPERDPAAPT
jgi:hypothetical protein